MDEGQPSDLFATDRKQLVRIAVRLLGNADAAEDAVQQTLLRWAEAKNTIIRNRKAWLTTVLKNQCRDVLRARRLEQELAKWQPEYSPADPDPMEVVIQLDRISEALLIVLQNMSPSERTVFVLHDVFGMDFQAISEMVGRTEIACRQLASRARGHLRRPAHCVADAMHHQHLVAAFRKASSKGDFNALLPLLDSSLTKGRLLSPN